MGKWFDRLWREFWVFMRQVLRRLGFPRTAPLRHFNPLRPVSGKAPGLHGRRKPDWVRLAVLALAPRELPRAGYRTLAHGFNLRHAGHLEPIPLG